MKKPLLAAVVFLFFVTTALASFYYEIEWQNEILEVSTQGKILLDKEFSFKVLPESTENGTEIWVGLPTKGTTVTYAKYLKDGVYSSLDFKVKKGDDIQQVIFKDFPAILPGENLVIHFYAEIPDLIYWFDKQQPDKELKDQKVSLSYIPAWWEKSQVKELTLEFRFAPKLDPYKIGYLKGEPDSIQRYNNMSVAVFKYRNVAKNTKLAHALQLPRGYFNESFEPQKNWLSTTQKGIIAMVVGGVILILALIITWSYKQARYMTPAAYITGKEACTTFDPVEAALFFNVPGDLLIKLILMGLMDKKIVKMTSENKLVKVPSLERVTWYEELFIDGIDENVELKEEKWPELYQKMVQKLKELLGGYCGAQTKAYYTTLLKSPELAEQIDAIRWQVLNDYLDRKIPDKPITDVSYEPGYLHGYLPLFYLSFLNSNQEKQRQATFNNTFTTAAGGGKTGGSSCACACACACASSGGCT